MNAEVKANSLHNKLRRQIWVVLLMNTVFSSVLAFSNIYINIFIWNKEKSLIDIGAYNVAVFAFLFVGTFFANYAMKGWSSRMAFFLSSVVLSGVFALLIFQGDGMARSYSGIGALYGMAVGLYYAGFNLSSILLTSSENRQLFMGMEQITNRLTSLVTPVFFSFLITRYSYDQTFRLIFAMLLIQIVLSLFSPKFKSNFSLASLRYREIWKEYRLVLVSIVFFGFFQSIVQLSGSVLLFRYVESESSVGWYNTLFALIGIGALLVLSRSRWAKRRMSIAYFGAILSTGMTSLLFFPNFATLIIFNILAALALPFIWVPVSVTHYSKIKMLACESEFVCDIGLTAHYLLIRELMLNAGRSLFYVLLWAGLDFSHPLHYIPIVLVTMIIPLIVYFCNKGLFQGEQSMKAE